jgi:hypothetical protein
MPSGKCIGVSPPHSLLHRWQHPSDYSLQVQEQPNPGIGIHWYPAGSRERQQTVTVRGESLAVALRTRPAPDDFHRRGRGCQAGLNQRGKEKGRRDQKTPQGGGSQRACSGSRMKTFVVISHMMSHMISHYDISIWYHCWVYDITNIMWFIRWNMISWFVLWYHSTYDIIGDNTVIYDIMVYTMISYIKLWYHSIYDIIGDIWYHSLCYDIIPETMIQ